jgi:SAM-dependent methyltransferase
MKDQFQVRTPEYLESAEGFRNPTSLVQIALAIEPKVMTEGEVLCMDAMAGTGIVGKEMSKKFPNLSITYQDKSERMLNATTYSETDNRVLSDASELTFSPELFDVIICRAGLNNVARNQYAKILQEFLRVLKSDGVIVLQDHFGANIEQRDIINQLETEVARLEGRGDETFVFAVSELEKPILSAGGQISAREQFEIEWSLLDRLKAKGLKDPDLSPLMTILSKQTSIKNKTNNGDVVLTYPVYTLSVRKQHD